MAFSQPVRFAWSMVSLVINVAAIRFLFTDRVLATMGVAHASTGKRVAKLIGGFLLAYALLWLVTLVVAGP